MQTFIIFCDVHLENSNVVLLQQATLHMALYLSRIKHLHFLKATVNSQQASLPISPPVAASTSSILKLAAVQQ